MRRLTVSKIHKIIDKILMRITMNWLRNFRSGKKNWSGSRNVVSNHGSLKVKEIPALQEQIKEQESQHPEISSRVEQVGSRCSRLIHRTAFNSFLDDRTTGSYQCSD